LALTDRKRCYLALQAGGLSYREISERERVSLRAVERVLIRAKRTLRERRL
jgi:DNA-directed RNA polymerase specialized sigma24 family protein